MKKVSVHVLSNNPRMRDHARFVKKEADLAIKKISSIIPIAEVDIIIMHSPFNIYSGLIAGQTDGCNKIDIALDVYHKNFKKSLREEMLGTLSHELYHSVRSRLNPYPETLIEDIIDEGLAVHFELEVAKLKPQSFFSEITKADFKKLFVKAKKEVYSKKYNWNDWHRGSKSRKIPKKAVYIIGHYLIKEYLRDHPDVKPSDLVGVPTKKLLKEIL